ncbi:solute carrier family 25 member 42 [Sclerotinia borealis F-4128]|uniref:Mitochondrial thiamine pyrophosphate carrier 1 n=1 Tax=Sclerotinia borealis (strain F-4128) TaxID=1432307 RepID=W9CJ20_SCLBF|nr:solute carrier family 25 member 42 [Sclerotinia borealis F-4128]
MKLPEVSETQNARDKRVEQLWRKLDTKKKGEIDLPELQKGLRRIDHPLKDASDMLRDVVKAMDKNGDEVIQYEEFRTFVEKTEKELFILFQGIDRDHDNRLDKDELQVAFEKAGLTISRSKLDLFFTEVDLNNDGFISFDEWRNFLLFLPATASTQPLKAVLSYYQSAVSVNAEGDTSIREDKLEGLGTKTNFLKLLFGAVVSIAQPPVRTPRIHVEEVLSPTTSHNETANMGLLNIRPLNPVDSINEEFDPNDNLNCSRTKMIANVLRGRHGQESTHKVSQKMEPIKRSRLTEILPDPGYYAAGAIAGIVSRTATAPIDRLKVYLIANVSKSVPLEAAKQANATTASKMAGKPLALAVKELWRAGGIRSLFAGNGLNVIKVMPESAIKFGSFEAAKKHVAHLEGHGNIKKISPYSKFVAGGVAGMMSQLFVYPIDTLKFRMQCETVAGGLRGNALIAATAKQMYKQGGIRCAYRGLTMGLVGIFPYSAIDLATFETLKSHMAHRNMARFGCSEEDATPGPFVTGAIGAFSGAFGASVVYPLNLLRTRLQAQGTILHPPTYTGIMDVAQKTLKNEGFRGLYKGLAPNLFKVVPAVSITYVVYEQAKKTMDLN